MSRLEIHMNEFRRVFKRCEPKMRVESHDSYKHLIRNTCILHKYLERTTVGRSVNFVGCIGGPICNEITRKLGLGAILDCEIVHKEVYDLIKKNYRGTVKI